VWRKIVEGKSELPIIIHNFSKICHVIICTYITLAIFDNTHYKHNITFKNTNVSRAACWEKLKKITLKKNVNTYLHCTFHIATYI